MTEKRFTISGVGISDHEKKRLYDLQTIDGFISVRDELNALHEENEQLKSTINTLTCDNTKMKKVLNTTKKENEQIKQVIKEAYYNERTELGKSVLKQLLNNIEAIQ